jgi:hypothetical protein
LNPKNGWIFWRLLFLRVFTLFGCCTVAACGPCGHPKSIDLRSVSAEQQSRDAARLRENLPENRAQYVDVRLSDLTRHPHEARIFTSLGLVRQAGPNLVLTAHGEKTSYRVGDGSIRFLLEKPHTLKTIRFTFETEGAVCDEGRELFRTYGWDDEVGPLTPLGAALARNGSLYRGSFMEGFKVHPRLWHENSGALHEIFRFDPGSSERKAVLIGGETLDFRWSRDFTASQI